MQGVQSFGDGSLSTIDERFVVAGSFLKSIKDDPTKKKLECLRVFSESCAIVEWILEETKGEQNRL
jgi:hypothetical protein